MNDNPHVVDDPHAYFRQFIPDREALLRRMEADALENDTPIIGPVLAKLLYILAASHSARRILELGTATGYSTIFLAQACRQTGGRVLTFEYDSETAEIARQNFNAAGVSDFIDLQIGDAVQGISQLDGSFDLIFLDIEKEDYVRVLPDCERLLRKGGLLIADNTAFRDADSFNRALHTHPHFESVQLFGYFPDHNPDDDGICIATRV